MTQHRILVMSHAHPDFSLGGGEIAAYNLYKAYRESQEVEQAWFLARSDRRGGISGAIRLRRSNEYLWEQSIHDWHKLKAAHQQSLTTWFSDLIRALNPSIVHTHHYAHLGLEYLRIIKQVNPKTRIIMTLHEYMAICRNNGQMIKTNSSKLCYRESFDECSQCFPDKTPEDFWLRKHYIQRHFELIDHFISPSKFLRERYIAWGIPEEKISVIENGQPDAPIQDANDYEVERQTPNRFGFFGQINPFKGLDVLLQALQALPEKERKNITLEVHGANLEIQAAEFREKIERLRAPLIEEGVVQWVGPYQPHELHRRMLGVDWVTVPSIWWENSPMVIQEALICGRPLLVSDIGGMREKVRPHLDGLHVPAGNPFLWSLALSKASQDRTLWDRMKMTLQKPPSYRACANMHLEILSAIQ